MKDWTVSEWLLFVPVISAQVILIIQAIKRQAERKVEKAVLEQKVADASLKLDDIKEVTGKKLDDIKDAIVNGPGSTPKS